MWGLRAKKRKHKQRKNRQTGRQTDRHYLMMMMMIIMVMMMVMMWMMMRMMSMMMIRLGCVQIFLRNRQQTDRQLRGPFPSHAVWRPGVFFDVGFARENKRKKHLSLGVVCVRRVPGPP